MILFIGALFALPMLLIFCFYKLGQKIIYHLSEIDKLNDIRLHNEFKEIRVQLYHIEAMMIQVPKEYKEIDPRSANRKPRTAAQKEASSIKRKEWWEKKRREKQTPPGDVTNQTAASSD